MDVFDYVRLGIGILAVVAVIIYIWIKIFIKENPFTVKFIVKTGIFAAISVILYCVPYLKFPLPIFPAFLEIHLDEVPILIASLAYGPLSGFIIIVVRTLIKLPMTTSLGVGELADLIYSIIFIIPIAVIYKHRRRWSGFLIGLSVGTISQIFFASLITSFAILNFYMAVMGLSEEAILAMCKAANPNVTSLGWTFFLLVAMPFNAIKDAIVIAITIPLYKRLHKLIDKIGK